MISSTLLVLLKIMIIKHNNQAFDKRDKHPFEKKQKFNIDHPFTTTNLLLDRT